MFCPYIKLRFVSHQQTIVKIQHDSNDNNVTLKKDNFSEPCTGCSVAWRVAALN